MKIKKSILLVSLLTMIVSPMASADATPDDIKADAKIDALIDKDLPVNEKKKIKEIMSLLDEKHRENVIHINADGSIVSNKKQLKEDFKVKNKQLLDDSGKLKELPAQWVKTENVEEDKVGAKSNLGVTSTGWKYPDYQSENANSGPYRRVLSGTGYSRLRANLEVPKKGAGIYMASGTNDKAYVYTGAIDSGGKGIDIGLAYNYESGTEAWKESWGMFVKGANESTIHMPDNYNFQGGQSIYMDFYVLATNYVGLYAEGYNRAGYFVGGALSADLGSSYKFYSDGTGMKIKRITSIAQAPQNLNSGSELNYVRWSNVEIGQRYNPVASQDWGLFYGYPQTSILVDYTSQNEEKVRIKAGTLTP